MVQFARCFHSMALVGPGVADTTQCTQCPFVIVPECTDSDIRNSRCILTVTFLHLHTSTNAHPAYPDDPGSHYRVAWNWNENVMNRNRFLKHHFVFIPRLPSLQTLLLHAPSHSLPLFLSLAHTPPEISRHQATSDLTRKELARMAIGAGVSCKFDDFRPAWSERAGWLVVVYRHPVVRRITICRSSSFVQKFHLVHRVQFFNPNPKGSIGHRDRLAWRWNMEVRWQNETRWEHVP